MTPNTFAQKLQAYFSLGGIRKSPPKGLQALLATSALIATLGVMALWPGTAPDRPSSGISDVLAGLKARPGSGESGSATSTVYGGRELDVLARQKFGYMPPEPDAQKLADAKRSVEQGHAMLDQQHRIWQIQLSRGSAEAARALTKATQK